MKVSERNKLISDCIKELEKIHDDYFPRGEPVKDSDWEECIYQMESVVEKYQDIRNLAGKLYLAFIYDIEEYHMKWIKYQEGQKT